MSDTEIKSLTTMVKNSGKIEDIDNLIEFLHQIIDEFPQKNAIILFYKYNEVIFGKYLNGELEIPSGTEVTLSEIVELRAFSTEAELHLWTYNRQKLWRLRIDGVGDICNVYDETHILWGTKVEHESDLIEEFRGMRFTLPVKITNAALPLKYRVRNYFTFDEDGLIQFIDGRLIGLINNKGDIIDVTNK
jgi:CRISPR-associated protein (TIGR03984 family)